MFTVFGQFGQVTSVKIMQPREGNRKTHGFVNFASRQSAENAMGSLKTEIIWGERLRFDWGNKYEWANGSPVEEVVEQTTTPRQERKEPERKSRRERKPKVKEVVYEKDRSRRRKGTPKEERRGRAHQEQQQSYYSRMHEVDIPKGAPRVKVVFPDDSKLRCIIDCLAEQVAKYGMQFESLVIHKEHNQKTGLFQFLFQVDSIEHMYYRWRLWSLARGESLLEWSMEPFQMLEGGPYWLPPDREQKEKLEMQVKQERQLREQKRRVLDEKRRTVREARRAKEPKRKDSRSNHGNRNNRDSRLRNYQEMTDRARDKFCELLRGIKPMKKSIRAIMCFCMEHTAHAIEICEIISDSFATAAVNHSKKLARLYLVNDILFNAMNSTVATGKIFRRELKNLLEKIFDHLYILWTKIGEIEKIQLTNDVMKTLQVWESHNLYTKPFLDRLRNAFINKKTEKVKEEKKQSESVDGVPMPFHGLVPEPAVDGVPMFEMPIHGLMH